jgi:hypothetical protein
MKNRILTTCLLILVATNAMAANRRQSMTTVSQGLVSAAPELIPFMDSNPAALVYQSRFEIVANSSGSTYGSAQPTLGAAMVYGNKMQTFGASLGGIYSTFNSGTSASGGLAFSIRALKMAFGALVDYNLSSRTMQTDIGLLVNPDNGFTFGFGIYNIQYSGSAFGAGIDVDLNRRTMFVCDLATGSGFSSWTLKPGFAAMLSDSFFFTLSYGFSINIGSTFLATGPSATIKFRMGENFNLRVGYGTTGGSTWYGGLGLAI